MKYKQGQSGNPAGRPVGAVSVKTKIIDMLFKPIQDDPDKLHDDLSEQYHLSPSMYFLKFIAPFVPKEMKIENTEVERPVSETKTEAIQTISDLEKMLSTKTKKKPDKAKP